jgi:hypothetical protein
MIAIRIVLERDTRRLDSFALRFALSAIKSKINGGSPLLASAIPSLTPRSNPIKG